MAAFRAKPESVHECLQKTVLAVEHRDIRTTRLPIQSYQLSPHRPKVMRSVIRTSQPDPMRINSGKMTPVMLDEIQRGGLQDLRCYFFRDGEHFLDLVFHQFTEPAILDPGRVDHQRGEFGYDGLFLDA
jgi:hypothetical protein